MAEFFGGLSLASGVVTGITNDTNVTGSISGNTLTLGWSGQLALTRGGTAASLTASNGGIFYSTASAGAILAGTATASQILTSGASTTPSWQNLSALTTAGTGISLSGTTNVTIALSTPITVGNGGTGATSFTLNGVLYGNSTSAIQVTAQGAANSVLTANAGAPSFSAAPVIGTSVTTPILIGGTGTTSTLSLRSTSGVGTTGADIIFQTGNNGATEAMRILNSGNVGIGTASPNSRLDVQASNVTLGGSTAYGNLNVLTTDAVAIDKGGSITLGGQRDNGSLVFGAIVGRKQTATTNASDGYLAFWTNNGGTVGERMRITDAGNVGIGITSPSTALDIVSSAYTAETAPAELIIRSTEAYNTSPGAGIVFYNKYTSGGAYGSAAAITAVKENTTDGNLATYLAFYTRPGAGGTTERMRIKSDGTINIVNFGAFATNDKYVIANSSGDLHISALGPSS